MWTLVTTHTHTNTLSCYLLCVIKLKPNLKICWEVVYFQTLKLNWGKEEDGREHVQCTIYIQPAQKLLKTHNFVFWMCIVQPQISRLYGLAQNVSTLEYCSTLETVDFREDFENFNLELYFFTTKYAPQVQSI